MASLALAREDTSQEYHRKLRKDLIDLTGQKIGDWTVLARTNREYASQVATAFLCRCKCGALHTVMSQHLRTGHSHACHDCMRRYKVGQVFGTRTIIDGPYPGRKRPWKRDLGWKWRCTCGATGYCNTPAALESRRCVKCIPKGEWSVFGKKYTANGKSAGMSYWAKKTGLTRQGIYHRLDMGWPEHLAITLPKGAPRPECLR